jgi:hypothetical protein
LRRGYGEGSPRFGLSQDELEFEIRNWLNLTENHISWALKLNRPIITLNLESLIKNPKQTLEEIANWMGAGYNPSAHKIWESEFHYIGGNHSIKRMRSDGYFYGDVKIDERWKSIISRDQAQRIMEDVEINYQLRRLEKSKLTNTVFFN